MTGCAVSALAMVILAFVPGLGGYLAAMATLGLGSGMLDVAPAAMIGDQMGKGGSGAGTVVASYQMAGDIGSVTGPVAVGFFVDSISYSAAFLLSAGVLGGAALVGLTAPETKPAAGHAADLPVEEQLELDRERQAGR